MRCINAMNESKGVQHAGRCGGFNRYAHSAVPNLDDLMFGGLQAWRIEELGGLVGWREVEDWRIREMDDWEDCWDWRDWENWDDWENRKDWEKLKGSGGW